jgi:hypothetical protein
MDEWNKYPERTPPYIGPYDVKHGDGDSQSIGIFDGSGWKPLGSEQGEHAYIETDQVTHWRIAG